MMDWELGRFAARHFGHLNDRKEREAAAEQRLVQRFFDDRRDGVFIEVGANEPKRGSQSWHLEQIGWRGLLVEPIPALCEQLRAERPNARIVEAACGSPEQRGVADFNIAEQSSQSTLVRDKANVDIAFTNTVRVTVKTIDDIIEETGTTQFDFISIDVEGIQLDVLRGFSIEKYRPALLLLEDHLHDLATHRHLVGRGYKLVKRTGLNNWYIPMSEPFALTCACERFALWRKLRLRTWVRGLRHRARQRRVASREKREAEVA